MRRSLDWKGQPARNILIFIQISVFVYQTIDTIHWIRMRYPQAWPSQALPIISDTLMGNSRPGPFTLDFACSKVLSLRQPFRFLSAGFLHGGIIHLLLNMDALRQLPSWLETGLGKSLYLTTYLLAIVGGNYAHCMTDTMHHTLCLGASGGVCGLYGLMYVCLVRMGNHQAAWRVVRGMGILFLYGIFMTNVSNAGHVGGFATGIVVALLSGPNYRTSYSLRRKNSLEVDIYNRDYRTAMGYDKVASNGGWVSLPIVWLVLALAAVAQLKLRTLPI
jgi:membrane associated rhomboid family serine protease